MKINNIGYNHSHSADFQIERPTGSSDYLLLLIKTPATFTFDEVDYHAVPNSFVLYKKGTPQYYRGYNTIYTDDWIHFDMTEDDLTQLHYYKIPFDTVVALNNINDLSLFIRNISYELYSSNPYREEAITLYFKLLILKLSEKMYTHSEEKVSAYYEDLAIIRSQIYNMPNYDWNISDMANQLSISKSYFQHLYKLVFDTSAIDDVIQSRITYAKYLLNNTSLSVKEIAAKCGYNNESYFMRQFKKVVGFTPSKYRAHPMP
ncbi:MAG: helix-turn-helix domain-containing protein [Oscillospiraceae bacterium]